MIRSPGESASPPPPSSIVIEAVEPQIDCGRYPVKREVGDILEVSADIFKDGHDAIAAAVLHRRAGQHEWTSVEMRHRGNDRWSAEFPLLENDRYLYTVEAFPDRFATWRDEIGKKLAAGLDVSLELREGSAIVAEAAAQAMTDLVLLSAILAAFAADASAGARAALLLSDSTLAVMRRNRPRDGVQRFERELGVTVDRVRARFASWYELFPRSAGAVPGRGGTFDDVIARLPAIAAMGFDVLYFPPIHPIGRINRKGPNNTLNPGPGDPGVPYAIGNETGGHDAVEESLGTLDDFARLVSAAGDSGLEIALDFAISAAPDHPWVAAHPDWFHIRPDGTIRCAENPPKRYEDIFPVNFSSPDWQPLWDEMKRIVLFWVGRGVKIFRVDNPHTKPTVFWEWLIGEIQRDHPETVFLSEAFTRPKVMRSLAKAGFTQSYTYFTWRNGKDEIVEYFTELTQGEMREYFRGNLFTTTPDILPFMLQTGGRPAFQLRLLLAATLSSVYGMYSGYELCEAAAIPGREEYLDSEKYDYKVWDWDREGNIIAYVTRINEIRRTFSALHEYDNLRFFPCDDPSMICYGKIPTAGEDGIVVVANLDPSAPHETLFHLDLPAFGLADGEPFRVTELITGDAFVWAGPTHHLYLDPQWQPGLIYALHRPSPNPHASTPP